MSTEVATHKKRVVDTSSGDARRAVANVVHALHPLRATIAVIIAQADRHPSDGERRELLERCDKIAAICKEARIALLERLIDAPRQVVGHSRVSDVEKALDNLEDATSLARKRLCVLN